MWTKIKKPLYLLWPPSLRVVMALVLLGIALPRLPFWSKILPGYQLDLLSSDVFGWIGLVIGIGLLLTACGLRLRAVGRGVAILAFAMWVTLAFASPSQTAIWVELAFAYAALGEIAAHDYEC